MTNQNIESIIKDLRERQYHIKIQLDELEALPFSPERSKQIEFLKQENLHLKEGIKDGR